MKKKYTDAQSYFQDWAQTKKKEVQNMEESMKKNPLYQKEVNPIEDNETWSERVHFILRKGLSEKEWRVYQKGIRQDRLRIWAMYINENPDYDYHYFLNHYLYYYLSFHIQLMNYHYLEYQFLCLPQEL